MCARSTLSDRVARQIGAGMRSGTTGLCVCVCLFAVQEQKSLER